MESHKIGEGKHIDHIQNISFNPFFASKLLRSFYTGYSVGNDKRNMPLDLVYIVLPLLYYRPSRMALAKAKNTSSLRSLFVDDTNKAIALGGLQERIHFFDKTTKNALIIAANEETIDIKREGLELKKKIDYRKEFVSDSVKEYLRAAHYLGILCKKLSVVNVYRLLGVTIV